MAGVQSARAEMLLRQIYAQQIAADRPFFVTDLATAKVAKVAANAFLAAKISFINAMAEVCDAVGGDVLLLSKILGSDPRIACAAFKPDSDDVRDSPALSVAKALFDQGAPVTVYDPVATGKAQQVHPELDYAPSMLGAGQDANVLLMLTEWPEFCAADPEILGKAVARRNIVDGRHALDPARWRDAGWNYRTLGRAAVARGPNYPASPMAMA